MPSLLNFASLFPFAAGTTPSIPAFVFIDILLLYVEIVCRGVVGKKKESRSPVLHKRLLLTLR
jgi:hypothetical protein